MGKWSVVCTKCNGVFDDGPYVCPACGGQLDVKFDPDAIAQAIDGLACSGRRGMWRYDGFLPVQSPLSIVSLGEGDTPLIKSRLFKNGTDGACLLEGRVSEPKFVLGQTSFFGVSRLQSDSESGCLTASCGNAGAAAGILRTGRQEAVCAASIHLRCQVGADLVLRRHVIKVPHVHLEATMGLYES